MSAVDFSLSLPFDAPDALALGAYLKNTVCVTTGGRAHVSPVIGDLGTPEAIAVFEATVEALVRETGARPVVVAHDLHPDFHSTRHAAGIGLPTLAVQHHHAHIAAVALEHGLRGPVLGVAFDGFGLGPGGQSWGGELLLLDEEGGYRRLGHLAPLPQPGGDIAAREVWRMGAAVLHRLGRGAEIAGRFAIHPSAALLGQILDKGVRCPPTSSAGRLFDAACGLLGVHPVAAFEGQAPMALEALVRTPRVLDGGWSIDADGGLDLLPLMAALADDGMAAERGAELFHGTLAAAVIDWIAWARRETGVATVVLGGGCFLNKVLTGLLRDGLGEGAFFPVRCSPGDPAISLGQAAIAAAHAARV